MNLEVHGQYLTKNWSAEMQKPGRQTVKPGSSRLQSVQYPKLLEVINPSHTAIPARLSTLVGASCTQNQSRCLHSVCSNRQHQYHQEQPDSVDV